MDDRELLRNYVERRSQDAFGQLVERHLPMVYSTARRVVRDAHLAEEVAQSTFTTLAQKADSIRPPQVVGGWLYNTTRHLAMHVVRTEQRRREREQIAIAMQALDLASDDPRIAENLEPAMAELDADDRDTLVLRYLENRSLREVGAELGISEDAARMRVNRALEKLRHGFERQGVTVTSLLLATAITATTAAVPAGLSAAITMTALAAVTTAAATQATVIGFNWLNAKAVTAIITVAIMAGTGSYLVQQQRLSSTQAEHYALLAQRAQLTTARDAALAALQAREQEAALLRKEVGELPRLRGEVTRLRGETQALAPLKTANTQQTTVGRIVAGINITNVGPRMVSEELVRASIHIKVGDAYSRGEIDRDVRGLYGTGLFTNVRISEENTNTGVILTYHLEDKPQSIEPGRYIAKEELAFVGYATPEAALQSLHWAMLVVGDYDKVNESLPPEGRAEEAKNPRAREQFEARQKIMAPLFKGMQILARKTISGERVELKVRLDSDPYQNRPTSPGIAIQPMSKIGDEWKLGGSTHSWNANWDAGGTIQVFKP